MTNNPKKSRAFIITFILVLLLLIAIYFFFFNKKTSVVDGTTSTNKIFTSLFGTSSKNVGLISDVNNNIDNGDTGQGETSENNILTEENKNTDMFSLLNPIPTPNMTSTSQHNTSSVSNIVPNKNNSNNNEDTSGNEDASGNEDDSNNYVSPSEDDSCPNDSLENYLTDAQKEELAKITADYYLIAQSLRTQDDIDRMQRQIDETNKDISDATILIAECKDQKANPYYTGPQTVSANPFFGSFDIKNRATYLQNQHSEWAKTSGIESLGPASQKWGEAPMTQQNSTTYIGANNPSVSGVINTNEIGRSWTVGSNAVLWDYTQYFPYEVLFNIW